MPGLDRATAAIVFHVPGEGSADDAAIEVLDGVLWKLGRAAPAPFARTVVLGEERARVVVAYSETDDLTRLDELAAALQRTFAHPTFGGLSMYQEHERTRFVKDVENTIAAGIEIADLVARGAPLTRFRHLQAIDALKPDDITRWITGSGDRVLELLPEGHHSGMHGVAELATALHDVDVPRDDAAAISSPPPAPSRRLGTAVIEDKLDNGLTVWFSPDPDAISIDARVVIRSETPLGESSDIASQAALLLQHRAVGASDGKRIAWYRAIGANVVPDVDDHATTFRISGFALFGDWHVWNLAWTLIDSYYPSSLVHHRLDDIVRREPPSSLEVLARRLRGDRGSASVQLHSADELEHYRRTHYDPRHATLIIAGKFDVEAMRREVRRLFSRWTPTTEAATAEQPPASAPGYVAVPVLHAPTLGLALGFASSGGTSPSDEAARAVLSEIINDRVWALRERLGISYGIYGDVGKAVVVGGPVEPAYGAEAARSLLDAIAHVRAGDPQLAADFARARKRVLARRLAEPLGASARAAELQRAAETGQGIGALDSEIDAIRNLDLDAVRAIAQRDMRPETMIAVVRGEPEAVKATLAAFGATGFDTVTR
jgi:predicted Zn-dependent peptidase